jgi:uncharacterized protein (TIGR02246 family)
MQTNTTIGGETTAGPRTPAELIERFGHHVRERQLEKLVALYEPSAVFVPQPGVVCAGHADIRAALGEMLALAPVLDSTVLTVHVADDTALVLVAWTLNGTGPDGSHVEKTGKSADVLRRQPDGTWRVLIDHP